MFLANQVSDARSTRETVQNDGTIFDKDALRPGQVLLIICREVAEPDTNLGKSTDVWDLR